jgi:hypothetical protein
VPGLKVGHAEDIGLGSGATAVIFDAPAAASIDVRGGGPGTRETALLDPAQTVEGIDAITLAGGSAFGLDAASGVQAWLREQGRGFAVRSARVPIVPAAILFDLLSGGDKDWGRYPPYRELGYAAAAAAAVDFALGSVGAGTGATTVNCKGGIGSASAQTGDADRWRPMVLGGPLRARRRIRRPRLSGGVPRQRARTAHQGQCARKYHPGRGGDRRDPDQGAGKTPRSDGTIRSLSRHLSRTLSA